MANVTVKQITRTVKVDVVVRDVRVVKPYRNIEVNQVGRRGVKGDKGDQGDPGAQGNPGQGVPTGGTTGQILAKDSDTDFDTEWIDPEQGGVTSVFGRIGDVVAEQDDYTASQVYYDDAYAVSITSGFVSGDDVQTLTDSLVTGFVGLSQQIEGMGDKLVRAINKNGHGLSVGQWVRQTGGSDSGSGTYVPAQADSLSNCEAVWLVGAVADANNFTLVLAGYVSGFSGLTPSRMYYLSPTVPGAMTLVKPSVDGQVIKPVAFAVGSTRAYLNGCFEGVVVGEGVVSVNGQEGEVVLDTDDISDTSTSRYTNDTDIARLADTSGVNTGDQDLNGYQLIAERAQADGYASLDGTGKVPVAQLPAAVITDTFVVASQSAMLALAAERGDVAIRTDLNKSFILATDNPGTLADWKELLSPTDAVSSVNGRVGAVTGLAEQSDVDLKAPIASPTFTGTVSGITKSMVGLPNVDNTSDLAKPVSTATQTALDGKFDESNGVLSGVSSPTYAAGKLVYDTDNESMTFFNNEADIALQVGQEHWIRVRNVSGSTILNGRAVYISGNDSGLPTIALARADAASTAYVAGIATHDIENNTNGFITVLGRVRNLDTSGFAANAVLYLSQTTAGAFTTTLPTSPNLRVRLGVVVTSNASTGSVIIQPATIGTTGRKTTITASTATLTAAVDPGVDEDQLITAQAAGLTIAAPTGSPISGQKIVFRIKDNGTARAISWNAIFRAIGTTLPSTTVINKTMYIGATYNFTDTRWDVLATAQEA